MVDTHVCKTCCRVRPWIYGLYVRVFICDIATLSSSSRYNCATGNHFVWGRQAPRPEKQCRSCCCPLREAGRVISTRCCAVFATVLRYRKREQGLIRRGNATKCMFATVEKVVASKSPLVNALPRPMSD